MKKRAYRLGIILCALSLAICFVATACLPFLGTVVGGLLFRFSDDLNENRIVVYGEENDLSVTFEDGKMWAIWDTQKNANYSLEIKKGEETKSFSSEKGDDLSVGKWNLSQENYAYADALDLTLSDGTDSYSYHYQPINFEQYTAFTTPCEAGFQEIDGYCATRKEFFELMSYLIIFREGATEESEDGENFFSVKKNIYMAYDYDSFDAYKEITTEESFGSELASAIDAYEDSACYAYSYELSEDGSTATLHLRFYYDTAPIYETDAYSKYQNATHMLEPAHYSWGTHIRNFPIDSVEKTVPVSSSDQLYFALKKGYRPLPEAGSRAEALYGRMRTVLTAVIDDTDSDYDKLHYLYDYLVNTVIYDYSFTNKLESSSSDDSKLFSYKCLYLEGVFGLQNNGKFDAKKCVAICDGLSKAYLCLTAIEGLDCVKVSGEVDGEGHAWNKVCLNGNWYMVDITWGNDLDDGGTKEYLSHEFFLVADDDKHEESPYHAYPKAEKAYSEAKGAKTKGEPTKGIWM